MWGRGNGVLFSDQEELNLVIHRKRIDETRVVQHSQDTSNIRRQKSILSPHPGLVRLEVGERRGGEGEDTLSWQYVHIWKNHHKAGVYSLM